ncbi:oligosaccharide flippase family protein [Scytonema sp. UIC 10036]|uniref:oligosaccharide flippase family protein n=1 Tax=Scytonema sp. UIC 10036 TaxID=2304196 RepID=UPI0012DAA8A2|nr:oligosaccharide flippase family protein [Scytonema sp. UIC 10036]MUG99575.1 oligosaccharide flippase family protein [Scytonema sp. UIC 10036]
MQHHKPLTLGRNFSWTFAGNLVYAACQWCILVALAKLGTPEMVGQFTLGLAVTAPILLFANLQLRAVQVTDAKHQYLFSDYLGLRLLTTTLALVTVVLVTLIAGYRWETSIIILVIGLAKGLESFSDVIYGLIQQNERMDYIAISLMLRGLLSLILLSAGVYLTGSVMWGAVGLAVGWAVVLVVYDIRNAVLILNNSVALQPRWRFTTLLQLVWLALPLGFVMMLISLNTNIPRYIIEQYLGERELGVFAAMAYLTVVGGMVVNALGESASARLAKYYADEDGAAFWKLLLKLVAIGFLLGVSGVVVAVVMGREILTLLYQSEYALQADVFVWLMLAAGIGYVSSFLGSGVTATRQFDQFPIPFLVATIMTAGFSWLLIPRYSLVGAAWAACASAFFSCAMTIFILFSIERKKQKRTL